ncbi:hypothetical protein OTU49_005637, partial [Cherax quadricarinatus]
QETVTERDQIVHELQNKIQQQEEILQEKEELLRGKCLFEEELREVQKGKSQVGEAATAQLQDVEESYANCVSQVKNLTQHNEEITSLNSQLQVNNTLLENITQHTQQSRELMTELSDCQQNLTQIEKRSRLVRDCTDIQYKGATESGVYQIFPQSSAGGVSVLCKTQEGHMWTVFLVRQRETTQVNFTRTWHDYKTGFGDPSGEYWLGNDNLHALTSGGHRYRFRVIATNLLGEQRSAVWETFSVANEASKYRVTLGGYSSTSTLGDALTSQHTWALMDGMSFTTVDRDHDTWSD